MKDQVATKTISMGGIKILSMTILIRIKMITGINAANEFKECHALFI
jgi:hypothetical protein